MPTPHDALFKFAFSNLDRAAAVLRTALPPALAKRIAWGSIKALPSELIGERLDALHTDLLFEVRIGRRKAVLLLLFEHQSKSDRWMPLRLLSYAVQIWTDHHKRHPHARLPAVIPVVLHHSVKGWSSAREFSELINLEPADLAAIREHLLNFRFLLDDLSHDRDEQLHDRIVEGAGDALAQLALLLLKNSRSDDDQAERLLSYVPLFLELLDAPTGLKAFETLMLYTLATSNVDRATIQTFASKLGTQAEEIAMTAAERLRQEGRQEGRRDTLSKLIELRFGAPDAVTLARLEAATEAELDVYAARILTAKSVADLLA